MEIKGYTYGFFGKRGQYRSERGYRSRELLFETGINWMCLAVAVVQKRVSSTEIGFDFAWNSSDRDIMAAVRHAHEKGIKVCMKPILNCGDGVWRAYIDFPDKDMEDREVYWEQWFQSYGNFMKYYAELAEETGCEMFCVGCEMSGTERKEAYWRRLIGEIRGIYSGKLIYNTNHGREKYVKWFDAVDYIGTSAYFPVSKRAGASAQEMCEAWEPVKERMRALSERFQKPVVFAEVGCRSAHGCAKMPWDFTHRELAHDEDEQAAFYDSCMTVFGREPWFAGVFWWDWSTLIYDTPEEAAADNGFAIHLKKAEQVVKEWNARL